MQEIQIVIVIGLAIIASALWVKALIVLRRLRKELEDNQTRLEDNQTRLEDNQTRLEGIQARQKKLSDEMVEVLENWRDLCKEKLTSASD